MNRNLIMNMNRLASLALAVSLTWTGASALARSAAEWQTITSQSQVSLGQAVEKAAQAGGGTVIDIELDDGDAAQPRYEADVMNAAGERSEIWVNAVTGVAALHKPKGKAGNDDVARMRQAKITLAQAIDAALKSSPGTPVAAELDNHWGTASYDVQVLQQDGSIMKIKIDATTGAVLRSKQDR